MTTNNSTTVSTDATDAAIIKMRDTYLANDESGRKTIRKGIAGMIDTARLMGDTDTADRYATVLADLVASADAVTNDLDAAVRVATFRQALADMEANLSDAARLILDAGNASVSDKLMARIVGLNVTRSAVSSDGARRAGSNESKGNVPHALVRFADAHPSGTYTVTEVSNWVSDNCADLGYTSAYPLSTGAITAALDSRDAGKSRSADLIAHIDGAPGAKGGANGAITF